MSDMDRRGFLRGTAWMGAAAATAGCLSKGFKLSVGGTMQEYAAPALQTIRVGIVGIGKRGRSALRRLSGIPGLRITAICDRFQERLDQQRVWLKENGKPPAKEYAGDEAYKALCESDEVDVVYVVTNWATHAMVALYAMEHGKHAFIEVPAAVTLEECWALVETSERTQRHCMQLENCCYGEAEMLCLSLVRQGLLGEIVHGEGAYVHDLRVGCFMDWDRPIREWDTGLRGSVEFWRLMHNAKHKGNQYETHGLGPVCQVMDINRGDRLAKLVSLESEQHNFEAYAKATFPGTWKSNLKVAMGDMNMSLVKTARGRSILVQHDVSSPRPYSRHNLITGTKGSFGGIFFFDKPEDAFVSGCPCRFGWEDKPGAGVEKWFDFAKTTELRMKYCHPLWREMGEFAKRVGGHGGMDFLMDLRWCYCLQNGLPPDFNVYDLASWCSLGELTERSVRNGSEPVEIPDFTRGAWQTAKPRPLATIDVNRLHGFDANKIKRDETALNVS